MDKEGKTLKQKALHELREFIWISFYLFVFFWTFLVYRSIILHGQEFDITAHGIALINALVLGKFMLLAKAFRPARKADNAPLIYPTLLKSAVFAIFLALCKILEDVIVGHFHGKSFGDSIAHLSGGGWRALLIFTVILFVVLIPLTAFGELERVVGEERLHGLFLRPRDLSKPFGQQVV